MLPKTSHSGCDPSLHFLTERTEGADPKDRSGLRRWGQTLAPRALIGVVLLLAGGAVGLAAGRSMANHAAHRAGACSALNMAAALGYLDAEQQRRLRHALSTALNPDVDLFSAGRPSLEGACGTGG